MKNNRQQPSEQESDGDPETKGAHGVPKGVPRRDGSGLRAAIKALDGLGAVSLGGAGVLAFTTHKPSSVICLFIALSAFASAVFLTKYPSLKRSQKAKRQKAVRIFLMMEVLFIAASGVLFWFALSIGRQQPANTTAASFTASPAPNLGEIPMIGASPSTTTNGREFLDIDPEKLFAFFEKYNDAQAEGLVQPYIGKWFEIQGSVREIRRAVFWNKNARGIPGITVLMETARRDKNESSVWTTAEFDEKRWMDRAFVLRNKENIKLRGQIKHIFANGFRLEHCEIIE